MNEIEFNVVGSTGNPYRVRFKRADDGRLTTSCTCPSGRSGARRGRLCKHRTAIMQGDLSRTVGAPMTCVELLDWFAKSSAQNSGVGPVSYPLPSTRSRKQLRAGSTGRKLGTAACIDIETSGFSAERCSILELAIALFRYDRETGAMVGIEELYSGTQDTRVPLSSAAAKVNGITAQRIAGTKIRWEHVQSLLDRADFLVAHNASFERRFLSRVPQLTLNREWRCSCTGIRWKKWHGCASTTLPELTKRHGLPHVAHTATGDVLATLQLLEQTSAASGKPYLADLLGP